MRTGTPLGVRPWKGQAGPPNVVDGEPPRRRGQGRRTSHLSDGHDRIPAVTETTDPSRLPTVVEFWDAAAATYDHDADHGLGDIAVREAWRARLVGWLPPAPADVLDLGCGTGSLSLLLTELGHRVVGVDLSVAMVGAAEAKCAGRSARFAQGDAADPGFALGADQRVDVVLARHLLWTLPDPHATLARWIGLLRPGGRLVLVEGRWTVPGGEGAYARDADTMPWHGGVRAEDLSAALDPLVDHLQVVCLSHDPLLWGRVVDDERYAVVATTAAPGRG
jgi:SAM-dependent methyltransferase